MEGSWILQYSEKLEFSTLNGISISPTPRLREYCRKHGQQTARAMGWGGVKLNSPWARQDYCTHELAGDAVT